MQKLYSNDRISKASLLRKWDLLIEEFQESNDKDYVRCLMMTKHFIMDEPNVELTKVNRDFEEDGHQE